MDPPEALEKIRGSVGETILAYYGVPIELAELGQGTTAREARWRFLHATVDPLGKLVAEKLTEKFGFPVSLNFDGERYFRESESLSKHGWRRDGRYKDCGVIHIDGSRGIT